MKLQTIYIPDYYKGNLQVGVLKLPNLGDYYEDKEFIKEADVLRKKRVVLTEKEYHDLINNISRQACQILIEKTTNKNLNNAGPMLLIQQMLTSKVMRAIFEKHKLETNSTKY